MFGSLCSREYMRYVLEVKGSYKYYKVVQIHGERSRGTHSSTKIMRMMKRTSKIRSRRGMDMITGRSRMGRDRQ